MIDLIIFLVIIYIKLNFCTKKTDGGLQIANNIIKKEFGKLRYKTVNSIDKIKKNVYRLKYLIVIHHQLFCNITTKMKKM